MEFLESLGGLEGQTPFDERRRQLLAKFRKDFRAVIERIPIPLGAAKQFPIGEGYWLFVESGGNSLVTFCPIKHRDASHDKLNFPLPTFRCFPGEFEDGLVNVPSGLAGTLNLWIARFPVPLPRILESLLVDETGAPISGTNPLDVREVAAAPLVMQPAVGVVVGVADTLVLAANAARRALWVGVTGVVVGQASWSFDGGAAILNSGLTLSAAAGGWIVNPPPICMPPGPAITSAVRAIGSAGGFKVWAQEAI